MSTANIAEPAFQTVHTIAALRSRVDGWKQNGLTIGFVPTMGALHEGHLSLVRHANTLADRTVVSIFVNPKQFAAHEDLDQYPRPEARDIALLQAEGCSLAFLPAASQMYPAGFETSVSVLDLGRGLCGASRPHFFGGVATVVCKLLNQVRPSFAVFGEKDYQQLLVIRRMVRDLDMDVDILGAPIVREADGLAMSSRNSYLTPAERVLAGRLNPIIAEMARRLSAGAAVEPCRATAIEALAAAGLTDVDYLEVRCERDLVPISEGPIDRPARVFVAVRLGITRLIDNWSASPPSEPSAPAA